MHLQHATLSGMTGWKQLGQLVVEIKVASTQTINHRKIHTTIGLNSFQRITDPRPSLSRITDIFRILPVSSTLKIDVKFWDITVIYLIYFLRLIVR